MNVMDSTIYVGTDYGGVFVSNNHGNSWTCMTSGLNNNTRIHDLKVRGDTIVAATNLGSISYLVKNSTNWIHSIGPIFPGIYSFSILGDSIFAIDQFNVHLSTDFGISWTVINTGLPTNIFLSDLAIIGNNIYLGTPYNSVYTSSTSNIFWTQIKNGMTNYYVNSLDTSNSTLYASTYGGIYRLDSGNNWTEINNGIQNSLVYKMASEGNNLYAATNGGVFRSSDFGNTWDDINNGLYCQATQAVAIDGANIVAGTSGEGVYFSSDTGASWSLVNTNMNTPFINDLLIDSNIIYAATQNSGLYKTSFGSNSWINIAAPQGPYFSWDYSLAQQSNILYVGGKYGAAQSINNGLSWPMILSNTAQLTVMDFAFDGNTIFIATREDGVHLTSNGGITWTAVNNNLNLNVRALAMHNSYLFAGTESGVYYTTNSGNTWNFAFGMTNNDIFSLEIIGNQIFAGTNGGGVFKNGSLLTALDEAGKTEQQFQLFPNPANEEINIQFQNTSVNLNNISISNLVGENIIQRELYQEKQLKINIENLQPGIYFINSSGEKGSSSQKFVKL
ncbi:MAG: T9SS type A sorting domain-containing protein [Bacteroidetes bacterium]|nr:T9SS type A sorting domain-containing protein [Bacteroidota bacterium]